MKKLALGALFAGLVACGGGKDKPPPMLIDAPPSTTDAPGPSAACDPLTQTGCSAGEKCGWVILQEEPFVGSISCVADGAVAVGGACMYGPAGAQGFSDCAGGTECVAGTCKSICDSAGGDPMCDAQHACSNYNNLFEQSDMTVAGVCDPKCDPTTQRTLSDMKEACNSMDPAMPNVGCYTSDFVDFTCARVPMMAKGKTDYMPAYGPAPGQAFVNGCEAGYVPGLVEMSGSMVTVCHGLCAAKKTDTANVANQDGDTAALGKLHNQAMARAGDATCQVGKKGSAAESECRFAWFFNVSNGMVPESQYNDTLGLCFKPAKYTYDHDGNAGTMPIPLPACKDLAPKGMPPANCTCDANGSCTGTGCIHGLAHEWGCYSLTDTEAFAGSKQLVVKRPIEFRTNYGDGNAYRHILQ